MPQSLRPLNHRMPCHTYATRHPHQGGKKRINLVLVGYFYDLVISSHFLGNGVLTHTRTHDFRYSSIRTEKLGHIHLPCKDENGYKNDTLTNCVTGPPRFGWESGLLGGEMRW